MARRDKTRELRSVPRRYDLATVCIEIRNKSCLSTKTEFYYIISIISNIITVDAGAVVVVSSSSSSCSMMFVVVVVVVVIVDNHIDHSRLNGTNPTGHIFSFIRLTLLSRGETVFLLLSLTRHGGN